MDLLIFVNDASETSERARANSHRSILGIDILLDIYIYIYIHRPLLDRGHQAARILEPINCYPVLAGLLVSVYHAGNGF
jgi:hypothetical protein